MPSPEWKQHTSPFAVIFFIFLLLFVYTKFIGPFPFSVNSIQTTKQSSFQVTGEGKVTAVPNQATISFGVTKQAATVADAQDQTNKAVDDILSALKNQGVDTKDIKTTDYNVTPQYNYQAVSQTITGYQVSQTVELKVHQLDKVNTLLNTITTSGANIVNQVTFGFDDATKLKLQDQAREQAVTVAKEKAQSLANIAGFHLGRIVDVQEDFGGQIQPLPMMALDKSQGLGGGEQPANITPGQNDVSVSVTLSYETY
ncbi:MAG: SIMPL domain-containing protein [Patescibacteria group bacterium]|nr:SIMPL domain-containing protein [Patescibacteria group bacterium]